MDCQYRKLVRLHRTEKASKEDFFQRSGLQNIMSTRTWLQSLQDLRESSHDLFERRVKKTGTLFEVPVCGAHLVRVIF